MNYEELVDEERAKQDKKWGVQNHHYSVWRVILGEELGEMDKAYLDYYYNPILNHGDTGHILKELIQCAAVIKAMYESGKRNNWL